jgi:hypothetical protein
MASFDGCLEGAGLLRCICSKLPVLSQVSNSSPASDGALHLQRAEALRPRTASAYRAVGGVPSATAAAAHSRVCPV